jgi:Protein of unknown function (DUF1553)/Protein of unknown function (DUF1549)/Planctomycete cytochrome C
MTSASTLLSCLLTVAPSAAGQNVPTASAPVSPQQAEFFEVRVRPVLAEHCFACHGEKHQRGGLRLDSAAAILKGTEEGPVLVPGDPDKSPLIRAIRRQGEIKMPPKEKLPGRVIADLTEWVRMGAPWPETAVAPRVADAQAPSASRHWAFQPVGRPQVPRVKNEAWVATPVDGFVLAALEKQGLPPAPPADRRTLLRRVTFDLIGLPPTPAEIDAFEADPAPDAFARVVDRLLASPHYGERWGRHWLDIARYADTKGYVFLEERRYPYAYTYRDYVIRAFNEDLPYDRFIVQQLAADRLPPDENSGALAGMGFLTLGRRFLNNVNDIIDDRIDVTSRGFLGLTVSCARCHDHKYDPIPQKDYYSLYGVFASCVEPSDLPMVGTPERTTQYIAFQQELERRQKTVAAYQKAHQAELASRNRKFREGLKALQRKVDEWNVTAPAAPPRAMILRDAPQPTTPHVFLRGNPRITGPAVPRQFLEVLAGPHRQPFKEGSGRLELARAIASKDNPLTARVMVNRIWMHHFGAGLVRTPSDFGLRSEPPTHPELLDYLARYFMEEGWSIKKLHRLMVLSRVYQQSSVPDPQTARADPDNRLLGAMSRRRLEFEALRDALLAVSGQLDASAGGRPVDLFAAPFTGRRTVYGFIERQNLPGVLRTFDFASPDSSTPQRFLTTVPQQALYLMNSPFVLEQARHLAARPEVLRCQDPEQRINQLYRLAYGRHAEPQEVALGLRFLDAGSGLTRAWERYAQVLLLANEFMFVD